VYLAGLRTHQQLYRHGILQTTCLPVPVVSIGGVVAGGSGKTPVTQMLAAHMGGAARKFSRSNLARRRQQLQQHGSEARCLRNRHSMSWGTENYPAVMVLSRGYHGGDETRQSGFTRAHGTVVGVGSDRTAVGAKLCASHPSIGLALLDDGLQHWALERQCDILTVDAQMGTPGQGNNNAVNCLLPRGLLREPVADAFFRADVVVLHNCNLVNSRRLATTVAQLKVLVQHHRLGHRNNVHDQDQKEQEGANNAACRLVCTNTVVSEVVRVFESGDRVQIPLRSGANEMLIRTSPISPMAKKCGIRKRVGKSCGTSLTRTRLHRKSRSTASCVHVNDIHVVGLCGIANPMGFERVLRKQVLKNVLSWNGVERSIGATAENQRVHLSVEGRGDHYHFDHRDVSDMAGKNKISDFIFSWLYMVYI
jgi:tetraacyldisaccharide-1-P 4'-kinase